MLNRREFIATSAIAMAGTTLAKRVNAQSPKIRVGVIGCHRRGSQVAENLVKSGYFTVKTLCDCDEEVLNNVNKELQKDKIEVSVLEKDFRRVLDDKEIEAVVVTTPDHWHALMTVMALDAGKHVYVEKPLSYNIYDGYAVTQAMKKHPKQIVLVGSQQRSGKHFQEAREFLQSGGVGKIGFVRAATIHWREPLPKVPDSDPPKTLDYDMWTGPAPLKPYNKYRHHYNWHFTRDYGTGDTGNWAAHWLDIVRWFMGIDYPNRVVGMGGQFITKDIKEWPDTQTTLLEYPELTVLWELRLWSEYGPSSLAEFHGSKGTLVITRDDWKVFESGSKKPPRTNPGSDIELPHAINFAKSILGEEKPIVPGDDGHITAVLCHLCNISTFIPRALAFDPQTLSFVNDPEADKWIKRTYRAPWNIEQYL